MYFNINIFITGIDYCHPMDEKLRACTYFLKI